MAEISNEVVLTEKKLADIIHCSVCCGLLNDARLIPCGHSYCLKCLEGLTSKQDVGNADQLACPECQRNCAIPSDGLQSLPPNIYVDALLQLQQMPADDRSGSGDECNACGEAGEALSVSEKDPGSLDPYSAETTAEGCGPYPVGKLDTCDSVATAAGESPRRTDQRKPKTSRTDAGKRCDQHVDREVTVFCRDCDLSMCEACFIRLHNGHRHVDVDEVAVELRDLLREDAANLRALEKQRCAVLANVQVNEAVISNSSEIIHFSCRIQIYIL